MTTTTTLLLACGIELLVIVVLWVRLRVARNDLQTAIDTINRLINERAGLATDSKRLRSRLTALRQKRYDAGRIPK